MADDLEQAFGPDSEREADPHAGGGPEEASERARAHRAALAALERELSEFLDVSRP
jgi:hypothetical protein